MTVEGESISITFGNKDRIILDWSINNLVQKNQHYQEKATSGL